MPKNRTIFYRTISYFYFFKGILNGAELFQLNDIRDICIEYLTKTINDENCLVIKDIADSRVKVDLSKKCLKYALKRFE